MITTDVRRHDLVGNGTVGPFTYQFLIRDKRHLLNYVDGNLLTVDTHYTVSGVGNESGGTVTYTVGNEPASNAEIILLAAEPCTQTTDYINAGNFPAASHEEALDKLTRLVAQLKEQGNRTPVMAPPDHYNSADLTLAAASPGEFLRWDSLGSMLEPATPVTVPTGLPVGGNYDHLTVNGSGTVEWAQQVYNFAENVVNVSKYATFAAAVTAIGSAVTTLVVTTSQTVAGNVTVPSTLRLHFEGQGALAISTGITVTVNRPEQISAGKRRRLFTGLGSVVFTNAGVVYPGWFGVTGDGTTDDTVAFQAAVTATGSGVLEVLKPASKYLITDTLTLPTGITILGFGNPHIHQTTTTETIFTGTSLARVTIKNLRLQGGGEASNVGDLGLITLTTCTDVRVTDNECYDCRNGIAATSCTDLWVLDNHVHDYRLMGILTSKSINFHIDRNNVHTCDATGAVNAYGITATGDDAGGIIQKRGSLSYNKIYDIKPWSGIMTHDVDGLDIVGNDVRDCRNGIDIGHLASTNVVKNILIANNYVEATTTNSWSPSTAMNNGISIVGFDSTHLVEHVTIANNVVKGFAAFSSPTGSGCVALIHVNHVSVSGNSLYGSGSADASSGGIILNGTVKNVTINGNVLQDTSVVGIQLYNCQGDTISIVGNTVYDLNSTTLTTMIGGEAVGSTLTNFCESGNRHNLANGVVFTSAVTFSGMPYTFTSGDTTPSVSRGRVFKTANAGATTITTFDDGYPEKEITIIFGDANTTLSEASNIKLSAAFTSTVDDTMTLVRDDTSWYEARRSVN